MKTPRSNPGMWLVNVSAFFLTLVASCWGLHLILPPIWIQVISPKLEYLRSHGEDVEVLFIGSSLVNRQIDPAVFDSVLHSRGIPGRSFNMGADGLRFPELFYVLDRVTVLRLPRLKWVVMESSAMGAELGHNRRRSNAWTTRTLYWHDWPNTILMLHKVIERNRDPTIVASGLAYHIGQFIKNYTNLGRMLDVAQRSASAPSLPFQEVTMGTRTFRSTEQGFLGIEAAIPAVPEKKLLAWIETRKAEGRAAPLKDELTEKAIARVALRLKERGVKLVLLVPPDTTRAKTAYDGLPETRALKTFYYLDPVSYPSLYEPRHRYNERHLNKAGAELFTHILANDFADYLATQR